MRAMRMKAALLGVGIAVAAILVSRERAADGGALESVGAQIAARPADSVGPRGVLGWSDDPHRRRLGDY